MLPNRSLLLSLGQVAKLQAWAKPTRGVGGLATKDAGCLAERGLRGRRVGDESRCTRHQAQCRTPGNGLRQYKRGLRPAARL